jgi:hypothetical protein
MATVTGSDCRPVTFPGRLPGIYWVLVDRSGHRGRAYGPFGVRLPAHTHAWHLGVEVGRMGVTRDWSRVVCLLPVGRVFGQVLGDPGDGC